MARLLILQEQVDHAGLVLIIFMQHVPSQKCVATGVEHVEFRLVRMLSNYKNYSKLMTSCNFYAYSGDENCSDRD